MEAKMVLPGDQIAVAEEYEPGDGTYEKNGLVFAATPGVLQLDEQNRVARVRAFNPPAELHVGDIVYGVVDDMRGMMATATIGAIHGRSRQISGEAEGTIHISNVSEEYTEDIRDAFHTGDLIRAKVIQTRPSVQLTTAEPDLGVVKALCSICRGPLERRGRDLYCPRDERTERRKLASDYDDLRLDVPATELGAGRIPERRGRGGGEGRGSERGFGGRGRDRGGRERHGGRGGGGGRDRDRGHGGGGRDRDRDRRRR
jgi:exosome complex component CSL4